MRLLLILLCLTVAPARAGQIALSPPATQVQIRTYGLGLLPLDGKFTQFVGLMRYEPSKPGACQVILTVQAGSLTMPVETIRKQITGPDFMDAERFPELVFDGGCGGDGLTGNLTLHGETHPFGLDMVRTATSTVVTGRLNRADWGITARPFMGGTTIRIRVEFPAVPEPHA